MLILGIESSCDDTSVALLECSPKGSFVISEKTASQINIHKKYGGVVPEIAGRMHAEKIVPLIEAVLSPAPRTSEGRRGVTVLEDSTTLNPSSIRRGTARDGKPPIVPLGKGDTPKFTPHLLRGGELRPDAIAVTAGPGLITGLLVGIEAARVLSYAWKIPLVAVNHIEGHIHSVEILPTLRCCNRSPKLASGLRSGSRLYVGTNPIRQLADQIPNKSQYPISNIQYPAMALVVSGGHTELIWMKKQGQYKILGATLDDAAGECFDKVAKILGLPYPGGPQISRLAEDGNPKAIKFPRPMLGQNNFAFSFAGLKTSALYYLRDHGPLLSSRASSERSPLQLPGGDSSGESLGMTVEDFCASFEQAIIDVLVGKTLRAAAKLKPKTIILAGGVSANKKLRDTLGKQIALTTPYSLLLTPSQKYCMDNAAMIAVAGYYKALKKDFTSWKKITADPNWRLA